MKYLLVLLLFLSGCASLDKQAYELYDEAAQWHKRWERGIVYKPEYNICRELSLNIVDNKIEYTMLFPNDISFVYDIGDWPLQTKIVKLGYRAAFKNLFGGSNERRER